MKSKNRNPLMSICKQYEAYHIDFVFNLLDDARTAELNDHLHDCPNCKREVRSLKEVLRLADRAEAETPSAAWEPHGVEMEVYRRLAAENEHVGRNSLLLRARHFLSHISSIQAYRSFSGGVFFNGLRQIWRGALTGCALVLVLLISILSFDGDQSETMPVVKIKVSPSSEQLEQYRWQDIHQSLEDFLVIKHLRNDEWETASSARMLKELAQRTGYENVTISSYR